MNSIYKKCWAVTMACFVVGFTHAAAQTAPATAPTTATTTTDKPAPSGTTTLDTVVVTADETILPTQRDISSVYGLGLNILDTPRSVSEITVEQLKSRNIESVTQLGQFSSGTYTPSRYGLATVPVIRGDLGELYQNGQRMRYNRNGFPVSFNAVEAVDVVKGPAPSPFGAATQVGGYVNFVTKQPYQDAFHGEVSFQFGDLRFRPERNFDRYEWNLDFGGPIIKDVLAFRVSYLGRDEKAYYQNTRNDTQDIFGAIDFTPYKNVHMQFTGQYYADRYNEAIGLNRVTQGLIDNGTYVTGGTVLGHPGFGTVLTPTGTQKIYPYESLNGTADSARAQVGIGQIITTIDVDDDLQIVNSDFYEYNQHRKLSRYEYTEYQPDAATFENRTEIHYNYDIPYPSDEVAKDPKAMDPKSIVAPHDPGSIQNQLNVGLTERYEYTKAYTEFFNEDIGGYDLTQDGNLQLPPQFGGYFSGLNQAGYTQIPGTNYFANGTKSNNNTLQSNLIQVGPFFQQNMKFSPQWSLLVGARLDANFANSNDPFDDRYGDSLSSISHSYNASVSYKPTEWATLYATYNYVQAYEGSYDSGGISLNGGKIGINDFHKESTLYEAGAKFDLLNHTLYTSAAGYVQKRNQNDRFGNNNQILARGVDLDMSYQPDKHFSLNANFSWIEENYNNLASGEATFHYEDLYPAGYQIPGGGIGTSTGPFAPGAPNFRSGGKSDSKVPGQPNILFNAYATYKFDNGLGVSCGPQVQGEQNSNYSGSLVIPAQFTWNAAIFYEQKNYKLKLDFVNFTDERNLTSTDPAFAGNDLILYEQPFYMRATVTYKF